MEGRREGKKRKERERRERTQRTPGLSLNPLSTSPVPPDKGEAKRETRGFSGGGETI